MIQKNESVHSMFPCKENMMHTLILFICNGCYFLFASAGYTGRTSRTLTALLIIFLDLSVEVPSELTSVRFFDFS